MRHAETITTTMQAVADDARERKLLFLVISAADLTSLMAYITTQQEEFGELLAKNVDLERQVREKEQVLAWAERDTFF